MSQENLPIELVPLPTTVRSRDGWEFMLTDREIMLLRKPLTPTSGGYQGALREAATRIYPGNLWRVSDVLMRRLYRMCVQQGPHGGYQGRLPMRVLGPVFAAHKEQWTGTWFYGKQEGDDEHRLKFGKTDNPPRRNREFSTDNPRRLRILFCMWDPSGTYEQRVKQHFRTVRRHEWYLRTPEVEAFVLRCAVAQTTTELPQWAAP